MTLEELMNQLQRLIAVQKRRINDEVKIRVFKPGSIGPSPVVGVSHVEAGIDWNAGQIILHPAVDIAINLTPEEVEAIKDSVSKAQSWHSYQVYKKLNNQIDDLKAENAELKKMLEK